MKYGPNLLPKGFPRRAYYKTCPVCKAHNVVALRVEKTGVTWHCLRCKHEQRIP